ncbi:MAG: hypothetical protein GY861_21405 [bacterium]|nr:hypothetical protein [bacterium]
MVITDNLIGKTVSGYVLDDKFFELFLCDNNETFILVVRPSFEGIRDSYIDVVRDVTSLTLSEKSLFGVE